jgi:hypothetical protein
MSRALRSNPEASAHYAARIIPESRRAELPMHADERGCYYHGYILRMNESAWILKIHDTGFKDRSDRQTNTNGIVAGRHAGKL